MPEPAFTELRIAFDGTVTAMHLDELMPILGPLGDARVERASHVEPDGLRWGVWTASGQDTGVRRDTRGEALAWERDNFWRMLDAH